ncbi:hypothetical protein GEV43_12025 [Actinomadura sp. J1-007]|uniref:hypothetical protein n=1 Tax=Actinomadura sp. J1-007 TaxID=2661913 RepID=UPI00132C7897|nr:hypothetical protein [Actinomadura sp. J1-007]MWK34700.1 hypothetical protein [Actinomadura sp. J1-007]
MISGYDTVLITAGPAGGPVGRFLRRWSSDRWPAMRVSLDDSPFLPLAEQTAPHPTAPKSSSPQTTKWSPHGTKRDITCLRRATAP